jgi:hypothetical protein
LGEPLADLAAQVVDVFQLIALDTGERRDPEREQARP